MENGIDSPGNSCSLKIPVQVTLLNSIQYPGESPLQYHRETLTNMLR